MTSPGPAGGDPLALVWHELRRIEQRVEQIDQQGPRALPALEQLVQQLRAELADHEQQHIREAAAMDQNRRWLVGILITIVLGLMPLYPILLAR